jgi:hypothetical protein
MQSEGWKHGLITGLHKHMEIEQKDRRNEDEIEFGITLYRVSVNLTVRKQVGGSYQFEIKNDVGVKVVFNRGVLNIIHIVRELRQYAKNNGSVLTSWQMELNDAFIDAGFVWSWSIGFVCNPNRLKVLLSKGGIQCYFEICYRPGVVVGNCYELTSYEGKVISGSRKIYGIRMLDVGLIVGVVGNFFQAAVGEGSSTSGARQSDMSRYEATTVEQVGGGTHQRRSPGAEELQSPSMKRLRLYDKIVDLLLLVRTSGTDGTVVPQLLGILKIIEEEVKK